MNMCLSYGLIAAFILLTSKTNVALAGIIGGNIQVVMFNLNFS